MYKFDKINTTEVVNMGGVKNKAPFVDPAWLEYIKELKGITPLFLSIRNDNDVIIGYFACGITRFLGIKVLGSPFWGWLGQHMGFTFVEGIDIQKSALIDELIEYAFRSLKVGYVQICSFNIDYEDIKNCRSKLIDGERYKTCYIDLTLPVETLQKNLKSGYRTSIRKFAKDGGFIEEEYSEDFIEEHHRQLEQVFVRNNLKTPNYRSKMKMHIDSPNFHKGVGSGMGIYAIKAMLPVEEDGITVNKCIASSYYVLNDYMAMFYSNASYSQYLRSCPNQALTWHAMMAFKDAGLHYLDMGGSGDYKLNFSGGDWQPKPIIICSKNCLNEFIILGLKRNYGKMYRILGAIRNTVKEKLLRQKDFGMKTNKQNPSDQGGK